MRIANVAGRTVLAHSQKPIDVFEASGGRFGPSPSEVFARWAEFCAWADAEYGTDEVVLEPEWLRDEKLGAPSPHPRQVFAIGLNYAKHAQESGYELPTTPVVFTKFPSCIVGPRYELSLPQGNVDWEVELVVVIGAHAHNIDEDQGWAVVAGLTVGQDLSERILQRSGPAPQFGLAKSYPGFGPTGPILVTPDEFADPDAVEVSCRLGEEILQHDWTSGMVFGVAALVSWLSRITPLFPGDLIFTGTPSGIGMSRTPPRFLKVGDELISRVEGIGEIRQRIVGSYAAPAPAPPRRTAAAEAGGA
ncbi:fumarylacetoacetate hydrolase family protein [Amycolatopsis sp. CA-126428]|uniref:fumarylacetoacetate hydrolase family protein n=1 Tax=Amycolatopsis sp. CA-126428 TaxID=2073158 RepID=UPI000CD2CEA9|nr:fumarylacetoacetate hydrolase family protein [Amycolatopsis sp. CA-126428]